MTNYEKIKSMSVEELARWLHPKLGCSLCLYRGEVEGCIRVQCKIGYEHWLESEVEE